MPSMYSLPVSSYRRAPTPRTMVTNSVREGLVKACRYVGFTKRTLVIAQQLA